MRSELSIVSLAEIAADVPNAIAAGPFGSNLVSRDYVESGIPVIRGQNLAGRWVTGDFVYVSKAKAEQLRTNTTRPGDVVFTQRGTLGQVSIVPQGPFPLYVVSQSQMKLTVDTNKADPRFIYYACTSSDFVAQVHNNAVAAGVPHINLGILRRLQVQLPARQRQVEVAEVLSSIDDRIDLLRQTNATLESIAQALFKSWFIDFDPVRAKQAGREPDGMDAATAALFPAEFEESALGLIPKGWRVLPFLEVCDLLGGAQPPASSFVDSPRDGYVRLLQIRDFSTDAHLTYVPESSRLKTASEDDVLIGRYGSASGDKAKDSLGRVCRGLAGAYNVALMKLRPQEVGREFALQLVNVPSFYEYLQGVSAKAVQSGFSKSELGNLRVVVPPRELVDVYEDFGLSVWHRVKENRSQAKVLESLRDTLLPRLISGKLRLPEARQQPEDAPA